MTEPPTTRAKDKQPKKLYGRRQKIIASSAMLVGVGFFLLRRYHDTGEIKMSDLVATGITMIVFAIILVVIVRKANAPE